MKGAPSRQLLIYILCNWPCFTVGTHFLWHKVLLHYCFVLFRRTVIALGFFRSGLSLSTLCFWTFKCNGSNICVEAYSFSFVCVCVVAWAACLSLIGQWVWDNGGLLNTARLVLLCRTDVSFSKTDENFSHTETSWAKPVQSCACGDTCQELVHLQN